MFSYCAHVCSCRFQTDLFFWVWSDRFDANVQQEWCTAVFNSLEPASHEWDDNWWCAKPSRNRNVGFEWSENGPLPGKKCTHVFNSAPTESLNWLNTYLCLPEAAPYNLTWSANGLISGLSCVNWREGVDPNWSGGLQYLCSDLGTPYYGDGVQRFHYANPIVSSVTPSNGPNTGNITITIRGLNFGTSGSVALSGVDCPVNTTAVYNDTYLECRLPPGEGLDKSLVVTISSKTSNIADFDYDPPIITELAPANGKQQDGTC